MPLSSSHIDDTFASKEEGIKRLLSSILNLNLEHESNEKHIISVINKLLSTAKHRNEGLEYLNIVIDNCSSAVIAENAINWINHCIIKFSADVLRELKLRVLGKIIEVAHKESEFNKKFVADYISKVLDNCITTSHVNPYECKAALKTLTTSMQYYPGSFGSHKQKIESFILIFLDSESADLVQNAALAFHYLQQIGSAGANGVNHKLNFTQNFHKLCMTVHKLYDSFFENEKEIFHTVKSNNPDVFEFQDDPSDNTHILLHINARRIRNTLKFIESMIKTKFPVAKETKPKELLEVISRGTSIHKCISGDNLESLDAYQFSFLLTEIQCAVVKLLRLFIIWYQANCLPFSYSISKVLVDSIKRNHNCECFKHDSLYQESCYRALGEWLSISKSSLHPQFQSQILVCILKDVTPVKNQVTLTISEAASGKKSQKAKRRAMADRIIASGNQSLTNDSLTHTEKDNEINTCKFALTALTHLLEFTRLNVKPTLLKDLYKSIFDSLTTIQSSKPLHPYTDAHCQAKLYEVLVAIYHQNTLSLLPPLQTSLDILTRGSNDSNRFISEVCHRGLRCLEMLCQPICPSLYLGLEKEEEIVETQAENVREAIEIEEMDVDEGGDNGDVSVDYDASTDEYSPNTSTQQNLRSRNLEYEVEQPDSDDVIVDDFSDNDTSEYVKRDSENVDIEDKQSDSEVITGNEFTDKGTTSQNVKMEEPKVLESEIQTCKALPIKGTHNEPNSSCDILLEEKGTNSITGGLQSQEKESTNDLVQTTPAEEVKSVEVNDVNTSEKEASDNNFSREKLNKEQDDENTGNFKEKQAEKDEEFVINYEEPNQADSTGILINFEEPPAKKGKVSADESLDMGDEFDELTERKGADGERDSNDLEDDSFVDEVKDYY